VQDATIEPLFCYDVGMRRALAMLLLVAFSFPLIAPALAAPPDESSLPACCRRAGAHHCDMAGVTVAVPARSRSVGAKCPCCPFGRVALMLPHAFTTLSATPTATLAAGPAIPVRDAEAGYRISADRTRQKRGPPPFLIL
jgi:hypothetical protein